MTQLDVFLNPVIEARSAYPLVVVLQADVARSGHHRAVAPLAPSSAFRTISGKLTPIVKVRGDEFVLLIPSLTTIPVPSFNTVVGSLAQRRDDILAAIDYLFFGI